MLFTPKYSCINCTYLQKIEYNDYNEPIGIELTEAERHRIKKGKEPQLDEGESLRCYQYQWKSEYETENHEEKNRLTRKRKECKREDYFYPYSPGKDIHRLKIEHDKERQKESIPIFKTPGWGWKLTTIVLGLINILQAIFIGLIALNESWQNWFFSFWE